MLCGCADLTLGLLFKVLAPLFKGRVEVVEFTACRLLLLVVAVVVHDNCSGTEGNVLGRQIRGWKMTQTADSDCLCFIRSVSCLYICL